MNTPAIKAAKEELETAEATILGWYQKIAEGNSDGSGVIQVFMAVARSVHRAAGMLEVVITEEKGDDQPF